MTAVAYKRTSAERRRGQPRSPVPTGGTVRRGGDCQTSCPARRRLRSGNLAQWCRRQGPIDLPARSGRERCRAQGTGHRWGAISASEARYCGAAFDSVATRAGKLVLACSGVDRIALVYPVKNPGDLPVGKLKRSFPLREGANNVAQNRFLHRFRGVSR